MGEQSRPRQPSSHASKPAPQAPPIAQSQRASPRLAASKSHHCSLWAASVLGHPRVGRVHRGRLTGGAGLRASWRDSGCLHLWGCPSSDAWWGWGAATSLIYCSLLQSPGGRTLLHQGGFCKGTGTSPHSSKILWTTDSLFVSLSSRWMCFSFSSVPAIQATIPPLMENSCSCSVMPHYIIPTQLQTVLVPNFLREQVFDVLQDMFLPVKLLVPRIR